MVRLEFIPLLASVKSCKAPSPTGHATFLALLPGTERHARLPFSAVRCPAAREDRAAECVPPAWKW